MYITELFHVIFEREQQIVSENVERLRKWTVKTKKNELRKALP